MLNHVDAFIFLPGDLATLKVLITLASWVHLNIHQKLIGLLNVNNFYDNFITFLNHAIKKYFIHFTTFICARTANELLDLLQAYRSELNLKICYKLLHLEAIQVGLQPLFLVGKDVTCFIAILDTGRQTFEKALITTVKARLNQGHIILQVELNFTLDLHKPSLTYAIKVLIQLNGLTMKPDESALAIHHSMTYKFQTHMFSMSRSGNPITRFLNGERRIIQPRTYRKNQLVFPPQWINEYEKNNMPQQIHEVPKMSRLQGGRVSFSFPLETKPLYPCEKCQIERRHPSSCTYMPNGSTSF